MPYQRFMEHAGKCFSMLQPTQDWYSKAQEYWDSVDATNSGMLGGYETISLIDSQGTIEFLSKNIQNKETCCDCGAGIGRVTDSALLHIFNSVDLVEQSSKFLNVAKSKFENHPKIGEFFNVGLQNFHPSEGKYDLIWTQW